jgi:hypothetical protein
MPDAVLIQMIPPDIQARSKIGLACSGTIDIPAYVPNPNTPVDSNFSRISSRGGDLLITTFVSSKSAAAISICSDCQSCSKTAYLRRSIGGSLVVLKSADIRRCSQAAVLAKKYRIAFRGLLDLVRSVNTFCQTISTTLSGISCCPGERNRSNEMGIQRIDSGIGQASVGATNVCSGRGPAKLRDLGAAVLTTLFLRMGLVYLINNPVTIGG